MSDLHLSLTLTPSPLVSPSSPVRFSLRVSLSLLLSLPLSVPLSLSVCDPFQASGWDGEHTSGPNLSPIGSPLLFYYQLVYIINFYLVGSLISLYAALNPLGNRTGRAEINPFNLKVLG